MPEFFGPLTHVTLAGSLWLIPFLPLCAAIFHVAIGVSRLLSPMPPTKGEAKEDRGRIGNTAILAMVLAFLASAYHVQKLLDLPEGERVLVDHVWRLLRFGQLDANLDLLFDPLSAVMCLVITGLGTMAVVVATRSLDKDAAHWRFFAWMGFLVFAMLLLVLADNFVAMFFGWEGVAVATWGLIGFWWIRVTPESGGGIRAFLVARMGDAALILGAALVFWGLGGVWAEGEYIPDLNPRFSSVAVGSTGELEERAASAAPAVKPEAKGADAPPSAAARASSDADEKRRDLPPTTGKGLLTLTSYPGAIVFMDDSRTPLLRGDEPLRAPFVRFPLSGGLHSFRIHPGGGLDDYLVAHVALGGEREVALVSFGPSLTFTQIRDQLAALNAKGERAQKNAFLVKKGWGGTALVTLACLLLLLAAATKSAQIPFHAWLADATRAPVPAAALLCGVMTGASGAYMISRLGFLFALSGTASAVVASVAGLTAILGAILALRTYDLGRALAFAAVGQLGLLILGIGVGFAPAGILHFVTLAAAMTCLLVAAGALAPEGGSDLRALGGRARTMPATARAYMLATLAITAAPIPLVAGFWSVGEIAFAVFTTENVGKMPGVVLFAMALVGSSASSFALWRTYFLVFEGKPNGTPPKDPPPAITRVLFALAVLALVLGAVLGGSTRFGGGGSLPLLEEWLRDSVGNTGATFARVGSVVRIVIMLVTFGASFLGWSTAKKRYGSARPDDWETREAKLPFMARTTAEPSLAPARPSAPPRVSGLTAEIDRWVLDGIVNAVAVLTRAAAWVSSVVDEQIVDRPIRILASGVLAIGSKLRARISRKSTKATG